MILRMKMVFFPFLYLALYIEKDLGLVKIAFSPAINNLAVNNYIKFNYFEIKLYCPFLTYGFISNLTNKYGRQWNIFFSWRKISKLRNFDCK